MEINFKLQKTDTPDFAPLACSVDDFMKPDTLEVGYGWPKTKSHLKIGNMVIHNTKHFNWFHRKMWKLLLGFEIENVEES